MLAPLTNAQREAWLNPDAFATSLFLLFVDQYREGGSNSWDNPEEDPLNWDPNTILVEIEDDFNIALPPPNFDRLMAAINIVTTDKFYQSLPDFITFCNVLSGAPFDPRIWDPADAGEIAWGITEGILLSPPDDGDENPFNDQITAYIGAALDDEGIIHPPDVLRIATHRSLPASIPDTYTDDPTMFTIVSDFADRKTSDLTRMLRETIGRLATQIAALPLRHGDAAGAVQRVFGGLATPQ
jgi:hypothetical protein